MKQNLICLITTTRRKEKKRKQEDEEKKEVRLTKHTVKHGEGNLTILRLFQVENIMDRFVYENLLEIVMLPYIEENMPVIGAILARHIPGAYFECH